MRCGRWSGGCSAKSRRSGGLPGDHHFYITFKTRAPGVDIPKHLMERFPDEMTIVIQNRFWDLKVEDDGFSVGLSFSQVPATLHIPFAAITRFLDPAVDFALHLPVQCRRKSRGDEPETPRRTTRRSREPADDGSKWSRVDFTRKEG